MGIPWWVSFFFLSNSLRHITSPFFLLARIATTISVKSGRSKEGKAFQNSMQLVQTQLGVL